MHRFRASLFVVLLVSLFGQAYATDFGQEDLEKIVAEMDKVITENPKYLYPVKCEIADDKEVNAYATTEKENGSRRAKMVVNSGFINAVDGDKRLIRACVAHELNHLSRGHLDDVDPAARDLRNLWTRQQEFEADKYGAIALVKAGYKKEDMVDLLLFLDKEQGREDGAWLGNLTADHADPKARAAEIADDPSALKALVTFDKALAYEDARSHIYAQKLFEYSADQWTALTEAYINAGECALMFYYDSLPVAVRSKWWRPDFGPLITNPHVVSKGVEITNDDRDRWKDAITAILKATEKNPGNEQALALLALGDVLEPDAKKEVVQPGIDWFKDQETKTTDPAVKLQYANNAGVGYYQLGDIQNAFQTIFTAQKGNDNFNPALGENLGLVRVTGSSADDDTLTANVLYTWLNNTPQDSPRWSIVKGTFDEVCARAGIKAKEIKPRPGYLCQVVTLVAGGKECGILLPVDAMKNFIGKPDDELTFADKWPDLKELHWHGGDLSMLTERDEVMRVTSYSAGDYVVLKPSDTTSQDHYEVKVGMSESDLEGFLNLDAAVKKDLAKGDDVETWQYFSDLGLGVLIADNVVKGITVTPVQYEDQSGS